MTGNSEQRRARGSRPTGRGNGPGRTGSRTPAKRPTAKAPTARSSAAKASAPQPGKPRAKPKLTGRAAVLVLVLAVLAVSYASSLRAYLQQRAQLDDLRDTISEKGEQITELEQEKKAWNDPAFVRAQARERLNYVAPGETPFVVLKDGVPLEAESELTDPDSVPQETPPAWWDGAWESVKVAGDPQKQTRPPLTRVDPEESAE